MGVRRVWPLIADLIRVKKKKKIKFEDLRNVCCSCRTGEKVRWWEQSCNFLPRTLLRTLLQLTPHSLSSIPQTKGMTHKQHKTQTLARGPNWTYCVIVFGSVMCSRASTKWGPSLKYILLIWPNFVFEFDKLAASSQWVQHWRSWAIYWRLISNLIFLSWCNGPWRSVSYCLPRLHLQLKPF